MAAITGLLRAPRTLIMGVLNVTPDSFSDGGAYLRPAAAVKRAREMAAEGADIIDIGGESTRPGAQAVDAGEELYRVLPVFHALRRSGSNKKIVLSIDTCKAEVARAALAAGAQMVNSVGGFAFDPALAGVVAAAGCPVCIYHIRGTPRSMQQGVIKYRDVVGEVKKFFQEQIALGKKYGVRRSQFILDPGIGFGKTVDHNLQLIAGLKKFKSLRLPLLVGISRKSHLGMILKEDLALPEPPPPTERLEAALAETAVAVLNGARLIRTHDIAATKKFLTVLDRIINI